MEANKKTLPAEQQTSIEQEAHVDLRGELKWGSTEGLRKNEKMGVPEGVADEVNVGLPEGAKDQENLGVPIDGGYGWVVVFCVFVHYTFIIGHNRALSALFIDVTEEFQQPNRTVSLTFTVINVTSMITTLLSSNVLLRRYTARRICTLAAVLNGLCTIVASQAPNFVLWLCAYAVKGLAVGTLVVIPMSQIGHYFKRRKSLASSLGILGNAVATVTMPPLAVYMRSMFGLRASLLLFGAMELHLVAVSMLMRPPESYRKLYEKRNRAAKCKVEDKWRHHNNDVSRNQGSESIALPMNTHEYSPLDESNSVGTDHRNAQCLTGYGVSINNERNSTSQGERKNQQMTTVCDNNLQCRDVDTGTKSIAWSFNLSRSAPVALNPILDGDWPTLNLLTSGEEAASGGIDRQAAFYEKKSIESLNNNISSSSQNNVVCHRCKSLPAKPNFTKNALSMSWSGFDVLYVSISDEDECIVENPDSDHCCGKRQNILEGRDEVIGKRLKCGQFKLSSIIDLSLFELWIFRMIVAYATCGAFTIFLQNYMAPTAYKAGISKSDAALLLTITGCVDMLARVTVGFISDMNWVSKELLVAFSLLVVGTLAHCVRFYTTYNLFVIYAFLTGMFIGFRNNLMNAMLLDYMGPDRTARGFGICMMMTALVMTVNHPIIGALADATGNFTLSLHYVGAFLLLGMCFLLTAPTCKRWDREKEVKGQRTTESSC